LLVRLDLSTFVWLAGLPGAAMTNLSTTSTQIPAATGTRRGVRGQVSTEPADRWARIEWVGGDYFIRTTSVVSCSGPTRVPACCTRRNFSTGLATARSDQFRPSSSALRRRSHVRSGSHRDRCDVTKGGRGAARVRKTRQQRLKQPQAIGIFPVEMASDPDHEMRSAMRDDLLLAPGSSSLEVITRVNGGTGAHQRYRRHHGRSGGTEA